MQHVSAPQLHSYATSAGIAKAESNVPRMCSNCGNIHVYLDTARHGLCGGTATTLSANLKVVAVRHEQGEIARPVSQWSASVRLLQDDFSQAPTR
jgi:hypothetical protein